MLSPKERERLINEVVGMLMGFWATTTDERNKAAIHKAMADLRQLEMDCNDWMPNSEGR